MSTRLRREEGNYLRLVRIIIKEVRSKLLRVFLSEFESKCGQPYGNDAASGTFFLSQIHPNNRCRDDEVSRKIQNGDSTHFDTTTLFYCLLHSGALQQPPMRPRNARMPPLRSSELIDQLRKQRNEMAHAENAEIVDADFKTKVAQLETIYQQLGWPLDQLKTEACNPLNTEWSLRQRQALSPMLPGMANTHDLTQILQILEGMLPQIRLVDLVISII